MVSARSDHRKNGVSITVEALFAKNQGGSPFGFCPVDEGEGNDHYIALFTNHETPRRPLGSPILPLFGKERRETRHRMAPLV